MRLTFALCETKHCNPNGCNLMTMALRFGIPVCGVGVSLKTLNIMGNVLGVYSLFLCEIKEVSAKGYS